MAKNTPACGVGAAIVIAACACVARAGPTGDLTALDVLDRFAATQQKLVSLSVRHEDSSLSHMNVEGPDKLLKMHRFGTLRYDQSRYATIEQDWGNIDRKGGFTPREEAGLRSDLWDGERFVQYNRGLASSGVVTLRTTPDPKRVQMALSRNMSSPLIGYFYGSDNRIDSEFRAAKSLSLRPAIEDVGGSRCYVIEAVTDHGSYTVWIDPQHGYHIAQAKVHRTGRTGDVLYDGDRMAKDDDLVVSLDNVRFEKIGDVWVPMEADVRTDRNMPGGRYWRNQRHYKRTEVIINPNHDELRSFATDHIRDGALVHIAEMPTTVRYRWQKGELIPETGGKAAN